jgi:hypothetical protein
MGKKTVTVHLRGGLGNQLFQYAAAVALSHRHNLQLMIDVSLLPSAARTIDGVTRWPSQISEFNHHGSVIGQKNSAKTPGRFLPSLLQIDRKLGDMAPGLLRKCGRFSNELNADFGQFDALNSSRLVVNSYCNSPRFFLEYGDQIRESIRALRKPSPAFLELEAIVAKIRPLAVHVRLGDYKNLSKIYGRVDPGYLARAIDLQVTLSGEREIWLFSDEPSQALELLGKSKYKLVVHPLLDKLTGLETILIMATCKGLVGSNSTFSWWAAYLNADKAAWAIFPRPFFARTGPHEPKDWLQLNWIQLGRDSE